MLRGSNSKQVDVLSYYVFQILERYFSSLFEPINEHIWYEFLEALDTVTAPLIAAANNQKMFFDPLGPASTWERPIFKKYYFDRFEIIKLLKKSKKNS